MSRSTAITRKKWMLIKTVCRALHFHTDKYKHTLVYKGTRDAFSVRKLQGWKAAADATERVDRLKVKSVSGIFQLEKLLPSTCCGKYVAMQLLQTFRLYFKKTKQKTLLICLVSSRIGRIYWSKKNKINKLLKAGGKKLNKTRLATLWTNTPFISCIFKKERKLGEEIFNL